MPKGNKSLYDKKTRKKFESQNNKKPSESSSKALLKQEFQRLKKVKLTLAVKSTLTFDETVENQILEMVSNLADISIDNTNDEPTEDQDDYDSSEDSNSGSSSDSDSTEASDDGNIDDIDTSEQEGKLSSLKKMSASSTPSDKKLRSDVNHRSLLRKLVRDDRRHRKVEKHNPLPSAETVATKLRRSIQTPAVQPPKAPINPVKGGVGLEAPSHPPKAPASTANISIRLNVSCDFASDLKGEKGKKKGKKGNETKLIVVSRNNSLNEVVQQCRAKFNVTSKSKFNALRHSDGSVLGELDLLSISTDSHVVLCYCENIPTTEPKREPTTKESTSVPEVAVDEEEETGNRVISNTQLDDNEKVELNQCLRDDTQLSNEKIDTVEPSTDSLKPTGDEVKPSLDDEKPTDSEDLLESFPYKIGKVSEGEIKTKNEEICRDLELRYSGNKYEEIRSQLEGLPIFKEKELLISAIKENQVVVVSGETGSGKTTQLPLYLLEEEVFGKRGSDCAIICTQPRRVAAISVAERVSYEAAQDNIGKGLVGYQIRLEKRICEKTKLLYCTTGILLRKLQNKEYLSGLSHIILDEVHERGVEVDFLMTMLKQFLPLYPHLRVVLMSATMQEGRFSEYFGNCPVIYVSGRTFPVQMHYLSEINQFIAQAQQKKLIDMKNSSKKSRNFKDRMNEQTESGLTLPKFDPDIIAELVIRLIMTNKEKPTKENKGFGVLVFLTGIDTIRKVERALINRRTFPSLNAKICILHGSLPSHQQKLVFKECDMGEWKIILSTNIAETSMTIKEVTHVIDAGRVKEARFDPVARCALFQEYPISRAAARQRAGRAGRVKAGHCWRIYSEEYFKSARMEEYPMPEIVRTPLEEVVLQVLLLELGHPEKFLQNCLVPPSILQLRASLAVLLEIKAILPTEQLPLTPLGRHLAKMPVEVRVGKMLIYSTILQCTEPALTVAASIGGKSPFQSNLGLPSPEDQQQLQRKHRRFLLYKTSDTEKSGTPAKWQEEDSLENSYSDHIAVVHAYQSWEKILRDKGNNEANKYARDNYLIQRVLLDIRSLREQFRFYLRDAGFLDQSECGDEGINEDFESSEEGLKESGRGSFDMNFDRELFKCALCAGFYPQVGRLGKFDLNKSKSKMSGREKQKLTPILVDEENQKISLHNCSLVKTLRQEIFDIITEDERYKDAFVIYYKKMASPEITLYDATLIPHIALIIFGGDIRITACRKGGFCTVFLGNWINLQLTEEHVVLLKKVQEELQGILRIRTEWRRDKIKFEQVLKREEKLRNVISSILKQQ